MGSFPPVSTLNYLGNDVIVNAAVVPLSVSGGISVVLGVSGGDVILDTNGYYAATPSVTSLNALTGDVLLQAGANVTITPGNGTLAIDAAAGSQGPVGPTGATGSQGPTGAAGATGPRGPAGAGAPSGSMVLGAPGDTTLIGAGYTEIASTSIEYWTATTTTARRRDANTTRRSGPARE